MRYLRDGLQQRFLTGLCLCVFGAFYCQLAVGEIRITGELDGNDKSYEMYVYEEFEFTKNIGEPIHIWISTRDFDAYLLVLSPDGRVWASDDSSIETIAESYPLDYPGDSAFFFSSNLPGGTWRGIVTSYSPGQNGSYELRSEGPSLSGAIGALEANEISELFNARGVQTEAYRRAAELERLAATVKELEGAVAVAQIREKLYDLVSSSVNEYSAAIESAKRTSEELQADVDSLTTSLDIMRRISKIDADIVRFAERQLETKVEELSYNNNFVSSSVRELEAYRAAKVAARNLITLGEELDAAIVSHFDVEHSQESASQLRDEIADLRRAFNAAARDLAVKLVESRMIEDVRDIFASSLNIEIFPRDSFSTTSNYGSVAGRSIFGPRIISGTPGNTEFGNIVGHTATVASTADLRASSVVAAGVDIDKKIDTSVWFPSLMPWPPPTASARAIVSPDYYSTSSGLSTLDELNERLVRTLSSAGYTGSGYFGVPNGFAIVTRMERIDATGEPLPGESRWSTSLDPLRKANIASFLKAIFYAPVGHYRVLAFVVTDTPFSVNGSEMESETLQRWSEDGFLFLPEEIGSLPLTESYRVTALIYESFRKETDRVADLQVPGNVSASAHLSHTDLQPYLM